MSWAWLFVLLTPNPCLSNWPHRISSSLSNAAGKEVSHMESFVSKQCNPRRLSVDLEVSTWALHAYNMMMKMNTRGWMLIPAWRRPNLTSKYTHVFHSLIITNVWRPWMHYIPWTILMYTLHCMWLVSFVGFPIIIWAHVPSALMLFHVELIVSRYSCKISCAQTGSVVDLPLQAWIHVGFCCWNIGSICQPGTDSMAFSSIVSSVLYRNGSIGMLHAWYL